MPQCSAAADSHKSLFINEIGEKMSPEVFI